jgi:flagellar motor switch/type III secretory pathway protein FliN
MKNITTLVHHIKLNETGWWEKSIQNIIISSMGLAGNYPRTKKEILGVVEKELEQGVDILRLEKQFNKLIPENKITKASEELWTLSPEQFELYNDAFKEQSDLHEKAENRFIEIANTHCPEINSHQLWEDFKGKMLYPMVKDIGAKTYEFVSGRKSINITELESFQNFTKCYNGEKGEIEKIVIQFMSFSDIATKNFLLQLLNEYFFIEATNLDEKTVDGIYKFAKTQQNLKVFVDTNFLLTILDLHDNPSNEATSSLIELLDEIENKVKVKFYILPNTIHEFQNLIRNFQDYIIRLKPTIAYAGAVEESTEFSGIIKRYFQRCNEVKRIIPPEEYFDPYLSNFSVCYRSKGIELFNQNIDKYSSDQRVVDDLLVQTNYRLERKLNKNGLGKKLSENEIDIIKNRIYDKFNHDCQIWHIVKDKRPQYIDSPKDVINWIITLDFSFLEYDKYKQNVDASQNVGICLHPNELISMLQFWVPRTIKFEKAILGNFRMPFLFKEVESDSEKISIEILSSLSQFEDHKSYSKELVTEILTNRALRQKIKPSNSIQENAELIKDEVIKRFEETQKALSKEKENSENLGIELGQVNTKLEQLNTKLEQISKKYIEETESTIKQKQKENIKAIDFQKEQVSAEISSLSIRLGDLSELKERAEKEITNMLNSFSGKLKGFFKQPDNFKKELEEEIIPKYFDGAKFKELTEQKDLFLKLAS